MPPHHGPAHDAVLCDVAVIGGGPAGAAAAALLAERGYRCLILERGYFPRYHIGESLIPHTYGTLSRLGLLPALRSSNYPVKHSVRFVSPDGKASQPFYFSETLEGERARTWQVLRSTFDTLCLDRARAMGAEIHFGAAADRVLFEDERAVGVRVVSEHAEAYDVRAQIVIDASGRAALLGRQLDLREPVAGLEKSSVWGYYRGARRREGIDAGETTIFSFRGGTGSGTSPCRTIWSAWVWSALRIGFSAPPPTSKGPSPTTSATTLRCRTSSAEPAGKDPSAESAGWRTATAGRWATAG